MRGEAGPGSYKAAYARAPFVFAMAKATALPGPILVGLMSDLAGSPSSNKALLHRMTAGGALELSRAGRVGIYRMAGRLFVGFAAVRGDGSLRAEAWDGRFHSLIYDIPESRRRERDRFLMAAHQVGYRTLRPGLLISPTDEHRALAGLADLGVLEAWVTFSEHEIGDIVTRAWRLAEFRHEYELAIARLETMLAADLEGLDGVAAMQAMFESEGLRTGLLLRDGALPPDLTPPDWPAARLLALVQEAERRLDGAAVAYVERRIAASPHAHLVEADLSWP